MNYTAIIVIAFLLVLIAFKWNNVRTKFAFYLIALGMVFLLILGFVVISGGIDSESIESFSSSVKTYASWAGKAGSAVVKATGYVFNQGWKEDNNSTIK